jgi:AraC-like DNA-binding protein
MSADLRMAGAAPHPAVAGYVRRYVEWEEISPAPVVRRELASMDVPLILNLGDPYAVRPVGGPPGAARHRGAFVAGIHDMPVDTWNPGASGGVQVDLSPLGARMLLGVPMSELARRTVDLEEVIGADARRLLDALASAPPGAARLAVVDRFVRGRLETARRPPPDVEWAWRRLRASRGRVGARALAQELGCSGRHLAARFRDGVGVGPKLAARILRFEAAREALGGTPGASLGAVAAGCGYYDQAHLSRDVRAFAAATPGELRRGPVTFVQDGEG